MTTNVEIRPAGDADWPELWEIIREVAAAGETFAMDTSLAEEVARRDWMTPPPGRVVVAVDEYGTIVGTANMYANRPAQGAHIASGSLMVANGTRSSGVGRELVKDMVDWATSSGFAGVQYNAVVETNTSAVQLYLSEGFTILGTAPGAFIHPRLGAVGVHIMWKQLQPSPVS